MSDIIDLTKIRNDRERPAPEFIRHDEYGREMFMFTLGYKLNGEYWGAELWAYDAADATVRVTAMRESLTNDGQVFQMIPA